MFLRFLTFVSTAAVILTASTQAAEALRYNRDIRPILSENCFACHGPDQADQKAGLRLDVREAALQPAKSGLVAISPGKVTESELITRILSNDADEVMPPPKSHKKLSATQKDLLKQWVSEGAHYEKHWAFEPPVVKPGQGGIDALVRERLAKVGLQPSPAATKETIIRRVTLDLTGLPPTPAEVDAFLHDSSEQAYGKVVDRLLQSAHYGERMAVDWLDAARFADTNGYQVDRDRELWPWRDWVIRAFNSNQPFDQFTIEQIAGDLLPEATLDQRIATGFHRNHMFNEEGGIIAEEFLAEYTADRVETTAAVWLGQTFNCCRCHDHKFDPFTQRDFYSLKAFFHNVSERGVGIYGNPIRTNAPPFVRLPEPKMEAQLAVQNAKLKSLTVQLSALSGKSSIEAEAWAQRIATAEVKWNPLVITSARGGDQPPKLDANGESVRVGPQETRANTIQIKAKLPAGRVTALRIECSTKEPAARFQWSELKVSKWKLRAITAGTSVAAVETAKVLDGNRKTLAIISPKPEQAADAVFELEPAVDGSAGLEVDIEIGVENAGGSTVWRIFSTESPTERLVPTELLAIAQKQVTQRSAAEVKQLADFWLGQQPEQRRLSDAVELVKKEIAQSESDIPTSLIMDEMKEMRQTFILNRGAYDKPGESVTAATPAVLPALDDKLPRNRLGLAQWLTSPQNPLTARVVVNRFWQQVFGAGLVRSSEDFGSQGELPSHPELLDWLAVTFRESGWDVKGLMRLMVMSDTYRQQSHLTAVLRERDPENRLLSRGPRHRLMAEMVRDQALAASGLLVRKIGGPSVKPYHPPGLYEQVVAQRDNPKATYTQGQGEDLHRRSLYTYWKRSVPHPGMLLFDAPFRETCSLRRPRTNTPLQALNLMNDPTYVEAARFLAQRMMKEAGGAVSARLSYGFRLLLARQPRDAELAVLIAAYKRAQADFAKDKEAAQALLEVGEAKTDAALDVTELATFTTVAATLINLDEVITKP